MGDPHPRPHLNSVATYIMKNLRLKNSLRNILLTSAHERLAAFVRGRQSVAFPFHAPPSPRPTKDLTSCVRPRPRPHLDSVATNVLKNLWLKSCLRNVLLTSAHKHFAAVVRGPPRHSVASQFSLAFNCLISFRCFSLVILSLFLFIS